MKPKQLEKLGIPRGKPLKTAVKTIAPLLATGCQKSEVRDRFNAVIANPEDFATHQVFGSFARELIFLTNPTHPSLLFTPRQTPAPITILTNNIDKQSITQLNQVASLPITQRIAALQNASTAYCLPAGTVLATQNAIIPTAISPDIGCQIQLTILDLPATLLETQKQFLQNAITNETRFGTDTQFYNTKTEKKRQHQILDHQDWNATPLLQNLKDLAHFQLGTSGSGNHFVEFGQLIIPENQSENSPLTPPPGSYLALLSHSGSRDLGLKISAHYTRIAQIKQPQLPYEIAHLAWLNPDSQEGKEYWLSHNLMTQYAQANHQCIHKHILEYIDAKPLQTINNKHNFIAKEIQLNEKNQPQELFIHRKSAAPAAQNQLTIIPGTMATPTFITIGNAHQNSLTSVPHGPGRALSRRQTRKSFQWPQLKDLLNNANATIISACIEENPHAYNDIHKLITQQAPQSTPIATFNPRIVKMAPQAEKPTD